uniref:G_PROTEIN_RECEP_F1_2 domain-containing protein n=1 Tax=Parastrongyloides trichosuri TaxID=131310 RepID=A0A0N5A6C8_PARTI
MTSHFYYFNGENVYISAHRPFYDFITLLVCTTIKDNRSSFEVHFVANFFVDFLVMFCILFFEKFFHWGFFTHFMTTTPILLKLYIVGYYAILGSVFGNAIMIINRYCALSHPTFYQTKWNDNVCCIIIILQYTIPIILFSYNYAFECRIEYSHKMEFFLFIITSDTVNGINNFLISIIVFVITIVSIILNIVTLRKYTQIVKNSTTKGKGKKIAMFIYMFIISLCVFFLFTQQTIRFIFDIFLYENGIDALTYYLFWIVNVNVSMQPIMILVLSKNIRCDFLKFYLRSRYYLCFTNFFMDLLQASVIIFYQKFNHWGFFLLFIKNNNFILNFFPLDYIGMLGSVLGNTFIFINRYCALSHPTFYKNKWTINVSFLMIFFQYLLPSAIFSYNFTIKSDHLYSERFMAIMFFIPNELFNLISNCILAFISAIAVLFSITINSITLKRYNKIIMKSPHKEKAKIVALILNMVPWNEYFNNVFVMFKQLIIGIIASFNHYSKLFNLSIFKSSPELRGIEGNEAANSESIVVVESSLPIYDLIALIVQLLCFILYTLIVIYLVIKLFNSREHFLPSFDIHFVANFFMDTFQCVSIVFFQKFNHWGFFTSFIISNQIIPDFFALGYIFILGSLFGNIIMLINRYCALSHPVFYGTKWVGKVCYIIIFFQYALSFGLFSFTFIFGSRVVYSSDMKIFTFVLKNDEASVITNGVVAFFAFIGTILSIIFNIIIGKKYNQIVGGLNSKYEKSKQLTLVINMIITTLCIFLLFVHQTARFLFGIIAFKNGIYTLSYFLYWILNINSSVQPVMCTTIKDNRSSFEVHFVANFFVDFLVMFCILFFEKFFHWGFFTHFMTTAPILLKLYVVGYYAILGSVFGNAIMIINRYCALSHPTFYQTKWNDKVCCIIIILQYTIPVILFSYNYAFECRIEYSHKMEFLVFILTSDMANEINNLLISIIVFVIIIISIILNIVTLRKYTQIVKDSTTQEKGKKIAMLIYMFVVSLCVFFLFVHQIMRFIFQIFSYDNGTDALTYCLFWIFSVNVSMQPIMILVLSKNIRSGFLKFYLRSRYYLCFSKVNKINTASNTKETKKTARLEI